MGLNYNRRKGFIVLHTVGADIQALISMRHMVRIVEPEIHSQFRLLEPLVFQGKPYMALCRGRHRQDSLRFHCLGLIAAAC